MNCRLRNTLKVSERGVEEGRKRSFVLIMWRIKYYKESSKKGMSYIH